MVATLAFLITAIIVVVSDIANLPGLLGGALNISGTWLKHAIDAALILFSGAICVSLMSRLQKARLQSEQKYETLVEQAQDGIIVIQDGKLVYSSPRMCEIGGYAFEEAVGRDYADFVAPSSLERASDCLDRAMSGRSVCETFQLEIVAKDGHVIPVEISGRPIEYEGRPSSMAVVRDMTERKKAEQALLAERENFYNSLEGSPLGVQIVSTEGRPIYANRALLDMWGYSSLEELASVPLENRVSEDTFAEILQIRNRNAGGAPETDYQIESTLVRKDGSLRRMCAYRKEVVWNGQKCAQVLYEDITERRKAEESLRFSNAAFQSIHESVFSMDGDFVVTHWNEICEKMFGVPASDAVGKHIGSVISMVEDYPGQNKRRLEILFEKGYNQEEQRYRTPLGDIWVDVRIQAIGSRESRQGWVTLAADINARKRAEEALLFKNALLEAQAETTVEGVLATDDKDNVVLFNRRFLEIFQLSDAGMQNLGNGVVLLKVAALVNDSDTFLKTVRHLQSNREEGSQDVLELKDGRVVELYSRPLVDAEGTHRGRIWYFRDITEPIRMTEKLERAAEEWRSTFDSITDLISIHDRDNRLLRVNTAFASKQGTSPKELLGKTCHQVTHGTLTPPVDCPVLQTLRTGKPSVVEVFQADRGAWVQESTSPIFGQDGEVAGTVNIIKDITEFRAMEQRLMMTDRLASIGELVSGIAHELNNPLTGVIGFSQLLMERDVSPEIKEDLTIVSSEAQRAARIVKNLLTFARKHAPVKQPSQINSVIEDVLRLRSYEQKVNNIEVIKDLAADLPEIMADYFQMQQVFLNLVINAEFFMIESHKKGTLTISTTTVDGYVRVSFVDDGPGILAENLGRIFDPFFTTKEVGKGTGLGLSICHGIVAEHQGRLYAKSEIGKGATFVVELPLENLSS